MSHEDDRRLIAAIARGDRAAFDALVEAHRDAVWRLVRAHAREPARVEEALQETFLAVWRGAAGYRGDGAVRGWILGLARRQVARAHRLRAGEPRDVEPLDALGCAAGWGAPDPEAAARAAEVVAHVHAALDRLSAEDREILVLRDLEQLAAAEVCALLDLSLPAQKSRLHRARLRLLAALRDGGEHG